MSAMRRSVILGAVGLVVLGIPIAVAIAVKGRSSPSAALTTAPRRAQTPPLPPADAVVLAREDGDNALTLAAGAGTLQVTVFDGQGLGVDGLDVSIAGVPASACGPGCYQVRSSARGAIPVVLDGKRVAFRIPAHAPDATALVARATGEFRSLRSVTYVERLASSTRDHIVSTFTLEAPDRIEYRIHGGAEGIVIGERRWDRTTGNWTESPTTRLPQPSAVWGSRITNAHLLARTGNSLVVSFLNPTVPAWFTVRFDRRTLRPRDLQMTATAHFMHHRYTAFDTPRRIFPPR